MRKYACFLLGSLLCALVSFSQLYMYSNNTAGTPDAVAANATGGSLARVNNAISPASPCASGFSVSGFPASTTYSVSLPAVSLQVVPAAGYQLSVTGFSVGLRRSGSGPASVRLAYSLDRGATWIDKGSNDAPNNGSCGVTSTATWTLASALTVSNTSTGLLFRIYGFNASNTGGLLQVMNLTVNGTAASVCNAPSNQPTALSLAPSLNGIAGSFTAAAAGTTPADAYLVLVSTSSTLSQLPEAGTVYDVDDSLGNARVISVSGATSFNATSLASGTPYYFFVFSAASGTLCYNTASPLKGNASTTTPPPCTPPATGASNLTASNITGSSIQLDYTRGSGDNVLILAHANSAVSDAPVNSVSYNVGDVIGAGNIVIYNGPASSFAYSGLSQSTTYFFALYEYNSATNCYVASPLRGNFTTACTTAQNVSSLSATAGNAQATIRWTNPTAGCLDDVTVVVSTSPITGAGGSYSGPASPYFNGGTQVVYTGNGNNVTVTNLANGTTYYAKVFSRKGASYSGGVQISFVPFNPASGYVYLYGNLHAHSGYSDGNKENTARTPKDDYEFARDANCMDFLGISEHNHSQAGMSKPDYARGATQADEVNGVPSASGNSIITLFGMEWGVISGGGHVLVYGYGNQLIGWESGNYDVYCAKSDYPSLWPIINNQSGAFATLAHPSGGDYSGIAGAYNAAADNAVVGVAVESGPAMSKSTAYNDYPSSLSYLSYYKTMLAKGYHLGAQMDGDNHYMTFGKANTNRMVVMASARNRAALLDGIRAMRFYASEDCNVRIEYKIGTTVMGGSVTKSGSPNINLTVTDPDAGESVSNVEIWGGPAGGTTASAPLKSFASTASVNLAPGDAANAQPNNSTWYYFAIVTQGDGNKVVTSPIWYTRDDAAQSPLPVTLLSFAAVYDAAQQAVRLNWATAQERNSLRFEIERSADGSNWETIGAVQAAGNSNADKNYAFTDRSPLPGTSFYRLKQIDDNGALHLSKIATVRRGANAVFSVSVYPNPAREFVSVTTSLSQPQRATVRMMDAAGREVLRTQKTIAAGQMLSLPLKGVKAGLYLLKISGESGEAVERIVVE